MSFFALPGRGFLTRLLCFGGYCSCSTSSAFRGIVPVPVRFKLFGPLRAGRLRRRCCVVFCMAVFTSPPPLPLSVVSPSCSGTCISSVCLSSVSIVSVVGLCLPSPFVSSRLTLTFLLLPQRLAPLPGSKPPLFRCCPFYPFFPVGLQPSIGDSRELRGVPPSGMRCCHPHFSSFQCCFHFHVTRGV